MKALVLAGGRGQRLGELADGQNKCMLRLFGKPRVEYSLDNAVRAGVEEIVVVVGYRAEDIINHFGNAYRGAPIRYAIQHERKGLVHAIECAAEAVGTSDFMLFLADEILTSPRHPEMIRALYDDGVFAVCGVVHEPVLSEIRKTYAVIEDERTRQIYRLIEKPRRPLNHIRGTGNCVFRPGIFEYLAHTPINPHRNEKELPDLIQCAIDDGHVVTAFDIGSRYININTAEDITIAEREHSAASVGG
jgi:dTDP-glucose pyrophosphorylase